MRAAPADCLAPIVAFANKRRRGGGLTAGNGKGRQRGAREAKGGKGRQRSLRSQCHPLPPQCHPCPPMPPFALSPQTPPASPATPSQAHPPKNQDSFIKGIPSPYSGVPYRAPIKYARCARFGVDSCRWAGAKRPPCSVTVVYRRLQLYLFRGVTKMITFQQVVSGVFTAVISCVQP